MVAKIRITWLTFKIRRQRIDKHTRIAHRKCRNDILNNPTKSMSRLSLYRKKYFYTNISGYSNIPLTSKNLVENSQSKYANKKLQEKKSVNFKPKR